MSRFEELQKKLKELSPIPVNMPKLYLIGDTGAGKTTIVRQILGTEELKFPSVQQKRTTVAVTEYVLSKDLPYKATYLFKTKNQISELVSEIIEVTIENACIAYSKNEFDVAAVAEDLEETPDERFRLKYILTAEQIEGLSKEIAHIIPKLYAEIEESRAYLESNNEELRVVVDLVIDKHKAKELSEINKKVLAQIQAKVSEVCDGHILFSDADFYQHSSANLESFISKAKYLLSSAKNSISPIVEYARLQGNLLASWLPQNTELVLIDGEGIGHDTREASRLSARHLDYFHFADSVGLVEECKKPFASGGKSAIEGIIRNGYLEKFNLIFTKLDEVDVGDEEGANMAKQIREVKKGLTNVRNALKEDGVELNIGTEHLYHLANMHGNQPDTHSVSEVTRLLASIKAKFEELKPQFVEPRYDYEMLSSYLSKSSESFIRKWKDVLHAKQWQTVKAFNRRMCWEEDEFRDMNPISDFHGEVTIELESFISHPMGWSESATSSMQQKSIDKVKQEFSKKLLEFARVTVLKTYGNNWNEAMALSGLGSTTRRKELIQEIMLKDVLPDYQRSEAIEMKDSIKELLTSAIDVAKA